MTNYKEHFEKEILPLIEDMRTYKVEYMKAILLNDRYEVTEVSTLKIGKENRVDISLSEVIEIGIKNSWKNNIILTHNHPLDDTNTVLPSSGDINFTKAILDRCKQTDFKLFDHIIIGGKSYISLREMLCSMWNENEVSESIKIIDGFNLQVGNNIVEVLNNIFNLLNDVYLFSVSKELGCFKYKLNKLDTLISVILSELDNKIMQGNIL